MNLDWHIGCKALMIGVMLCAVSCSKEEAQCFEGRGEQTTELRLLEPFEYIHLKDRMDVVFIEDSSNYAVITYGENGLGGIKTRQDGLDLVLSEENTCDWMRKVRPLPKVEIHFTRMNAIYSENSGTVVFDQPFTGDQLLLEVYDVSGQIDLKVDCPKLEVKIHTGATDVNVSGTAGYAYFYNSGYAPLHAEELNAKTVSVHNNSQGDTYVYGWETIYYQIYEQGDLYIKGDAKVVKWQQTGGGQVFFVD